MDSYEDIIEHPHHVSRKHPQMSMRDRAAQFSPFAALTGYEDAVRETARLTEQRIELDEYEKEILDGRLQMLREHMQDQLEVRIIYFVPDERKEGGAYVTVQGRAKKIDDYRRQIVLLEGTVIPIDEIIEVILLSRNEIEI